MTQTADHYTLQELSTRFELELRGDGAQRINGVGTLMQATESQVSFLANPSYRKELSGTRAGAVIVSEADAGNCPGNALIAKDPYLAYARLATLFDPRPRARPGIHAGAVVSESAQLGEGVSIGANAVIGDDCVIGDGSVIGPGSVLEANCQLGRQCQLFANVSLGYGVQLGDRVIVHPGAVIGADGFGIALATDHWEKVPQLGTVIIGDDCEIGCNTTIDRGAIGDTVLEEDVRIDNQVQVAHNVHIGAHSAIAGLVGIAGSTRIGRYCLFAGRAGASGHLDIADKTTVAANSVVFRNITEPGTTWSAQIDSLPIRDWQKNVARLRKLDELARRLIALEKQFERETKQ